jgi:hypothetical protein
MIWGAHEAAAIDLLQPELGFDRDRKGVQRDEQLGGATLQWAAALPGKGGVGFTNAGSNRC